jgi:hypothetical protein
VFLLTFLPSYNFRKQTTDYKPLPTKKEILIKNRADSSRHKLVHLNPTTARWSLGVYLAPDGWAKKQIWISTLKAKEFSGKFHNSSLSQKIKWMALQAIIEPSVTYPLVNTYFNDQEMYPLESTMSTMQCSALGLNQHFPRALLHGSTLLGGIGIITPTNFLPISPVTIKDSKGSVSQLISTV